MRARGECVGKWSDLVMGIAGGAADYSKAMDASQVKRKRYDRLGQELDDEGHVLPDGPRGK